MSMWMTALNRVFLINVGANASHGLLRSPIFDDNTFEFLPIPDDYYSNLPRYSDLSSPNRLEYYRFIPKSYQDLRVHNDPEFNFYTYGDYPTWSPRAMNLRKAVKGDFFFFLARLVRYHNGTFSKPGFFLIGCFEIDAILKDVYQKPSGHELRFFGSNAHIKRALNNRLLWDGFWVFKGSKKSRRFKYAIPFDRGFCDAVLLDAFGNK